MLYVRRCSDVFRSIFWTSLSLRSRVSVAAVAVALDVAAAAAGTSGGAAAAAAAAAVAPAHPLKASLGVCNALRVLVRRASYSAKTRARAKRALARSEKKASLRFPFLEEWSIFQSSSTRRPSSSWRANDVDRLNDRIHRHALQVNDGECILSEGRKIF